MTKEKSNLTAFHSFLVITVYLMIALDFILYIFYFSPTAAPFRTALFKMHKVPFFGDILYMKYATLFLIVIVGIGTTSRKNLELSWFKHIILPTIFGLLLFFGSLIFFQFPKLPYRLSTENYIYMIFSVLGAILINIGFDNISKKFRSNMGKDFWNIENESWQQETQLRSNQYSVNIETLFYFKKRNHKGWLNIVNIFRGNLVIGIPGSGKTFSVILAFIRQCLKKEFALLVYDYKYPDLHEVCYAHYVQMKKKGKLKKHRYAILDINNIENSVRVNPLSPKYITNLAECMETAEALIEALRKGGSKQGGGADQFFTQSAVNLLGAIFYFLLKHEKGRYCTLPHAISLLNKDYETLFKILFDDAELVSLLSPFANAYKNKAFNQLEGQVGTLKVNLGRLATKESFWAFSADEFDLDINNPERPAIFILSNDPATLNINGAFYSVVLNRVSPLMNKKGKIPSLIAVDELPTLYYHKLEHVLATARSNKIAVVLGIQDLPQLRLNWSPETAKALVSIIGNIFCGIVRDKETLDWMEKLFGKVRQGSQSVSVDNLKSSINLSDRMDNLLQSGKISSLKTGEMVGVLANDMDKSNKFVSSAFSAKLLPDEEAIKFEAKHKMKPKPRIIFKSKEDKEKILLANFKKIFLEVEAICASY